MKYEEIIYLITSFYKFALRREPGENEVMAWTGAVISRDDYAKALADVLEIFINSLEYKVFIFSNMPSEKINEFIKEKQPKSIVIYGTNSDSGNLYLMLKYCSDFIGDVKYFVDKNNTGEFFSLPVKQSVELEEIDYILVPDTAIYLYSDSVTTDVLINKTIKCKLELEFFLDIPDEYNRIDSVRFMDLLGKEISIYSQGKTGVRVVSLINELNSVFEKAFGKIITIGDIIELGEQTMENNEKFGDRILIAQDKRYEKTLDTLLKAGVSVEYIRIVNFFDSEAQISDLYLKPDAVLVYTMRKVGTISISSALQSYGIQYIPFHYVSLEPLADLEVYRPTIEKTWWYYFTNTIYASTYIKENMGKSEIDIITGVREPLAQMLSHYFEQLSPYFLSGMKSIKSSIAAFKLEALDFINESMQKGDWFDYEMKKSIGLDVYQCSFEPSKGYQIIKNQGVHLLIIRLEDLDRVWAQALTEFLGEERLKKINLNLNKANETSDKSIADLYKEVKSAIRIDRKLINKVYSSKQVKHFYSKQEIKKFKQYWLNPNR